MAVTRPPRRGRAAEVYARILDAVGDRVDEIGGHHHHVAAHLPFVGSRYRGLVIVGQALDGWDAAVTPARWRLEQARRPEDRDRLLRGAQDWATARDEPISEVLRWGHRRGAPFWGFARRVVPLLESDAGGDWFSRYAWWNVYPLGEQEVMDLFTLASDLQRLARLRSEDASVQAASVAGMSGPR